MTFIGIIPARYASTRFPGKPLIDINGKSMINRVYDQVLKSESISQVYVATDDDRIKDHVESFGGNVVMTSVDHQSGTDRCYEAASKVNANSEDIIINIQGDEPFIEPEQINELARCFDNERTQIATLVHKLKVTKDIFDPNVVKAVFDNNYFAKYFSRSPIPYIRGEKEENWVRLGKFYKHIGIYAYRFNVLKEITSLKQSTLEISESLEQLRWIENGYQIAVGITKFQSVSIDTPEDLENLLK